MVRVENALLSSCN